MSRVTLAIWLALASLSPAHAQQSAAYKHGYADFDLVQKWHDAAIKSTSPADRVCAKQIIDELTAEAVVKGIVKDWYGKDKPPRQPRAWEPFDAFCDREGLALLAVVLDQFENPDYLAGFEARRRSQ